MVRNKDLASEQMTREEIERMPWIFASEFEPFDRSDMRDLFDERELFYVSEYEFWDHVNGMPSGVDKYQELVPEYLSAVRKELVRLFDWYEKAMGFLVGEVDEGFRRKHLEQHDFMTDVAKRYVKGLVIRTLNIPGVDERNRLRDMEKSAEFFKQFGIVLSKIHTAKMSKDMLLQGFGTIIRNAEDKLRNEDPVKYEEYYEMKHAEWDRIEEVLRKERVRLTNEYTKS